MATCSTCDEPLDLEQRFCSACGAGVQQIELMDASAAPTVSKQTVSRGGGLDSKWYPAIGLVLAAIVGWSILSSGASDELADDGETELADPTTSEAETTTTEAPTTNADDDSTTERPTRTEEVGDSSTDDEEDPPAVFITNGPIGDTGLTLVTSNPIRFLDLDTGEVVETGLRNLNPVAVVGDRLIVNSESSGNNLKALDLNDLEAPAEDFDSPNGYLFSFTVGDDPSTIVAIGDNYSSGPELSRYVFDAETGAIIDESTVEINIGFFGGWITDGDFTTPRSGGVYRSVGSGFELVGPGRVVAQGAGLVLIEECDESLDCDFSWRDADTYDEVALPTPPDVEDGLVLAAGRLLAFRSSSSWQASLFDLETGEVIETELEQSENLGIAVSPDNRLVAFVGHGNTQILDLETGKQHLVQFEAGSGFYGSSLLLIPSR